MIACNRTKTGNIHDVDELEIPEIGEVFVYNKEKHKIKRIVPHPIVRAIIYFECPKGNTGACILSHWWDKHEEEEAKIGTIDE